MMRGGRPIPDPFAVGLSADGPEVTISVVGEVDMATVGTLQTELDRAIEHFAGDVTVNLAAVTFMDSTGLCSLLRAHAALVPLGRSLLIADPAPSTKRLFRLAGVLDTLQRSSGPT